MKIAIFGATGDTGHRFCRRAIDAGHQIVPFSFRRTEINGVIEIQSTPLDLNDDDAVLQALEGVDAIVSAIGGEKNSRRFSIAQLTKHATTKGITRLISIGGAGILSSSTGELLKNQSFYPDFLVPISNAHYEVWQALEQSTLQWTMICPGVMREGLSTGSYRHQATTSLPDMKGILYDDVAHLILECLEKKLYIRNKVSISNP